MRPTAVASSGNAVPIPSLYETVRYNARVPNVAAPLLCHEILSASPCLSAAAMALAFCLGDNITHKQMPEGRFRVFPLPLCVVVPRDEVGPLLPHPTRTPASGLVLLRGVWRPYLTYGLQR